MFTIFIVANCGGLLTPLGDPPLFLGMLRGVPFEWTLTLFPQWLFVNVLLLATYYGLDRRAYAAETPEAIASDESQRSPLGLRGAVNLVFFAMIIAAVAFAPSVDLHAIETGHAAWHQFVPWRELVMLAAGAMSYFLGDRVARFELNQFSWTPILEVAALFIGIFLTMIPALNFLGQIADRLPLNRITVFIFTGGISGVLDNAPTYATFFEIASRFPGEPRVADVPEVLLTPVALGAVLGGALTYIGNGPNFMVKSVADAVGVETPSFGGYVVQSLTYLVPVFAAMALIFLTDAWLWRASASRSPPPSSCAPPCSRAGTDDLEHLSGLVGLNGRCSRSQRERTRESAQGEGRSAPTAAAPSEVAMVSEPATSAGQSAETTPSRPTSTPSTPLSTNSHHAPAEEQAQSIR